MTPQEKLQAIEAARAAGIDLEMLESNLQLSVEERWARHEAALELALALCEAGVTVDLENHPLTAKDLHAIAAKSSL